MGAVARILTVLVAGIWLGATSQAAAAEELVDNPQYQAWAKFAVGTRVTVLNESHVSVSEAAKALTMTRTLVELTPSVAVLEVTKVLEEEKPATTQAMGTIEIPARISKEEITQPWRFTPEAGERKALADERVTLGGKSYTCKVFRHIFQQPGVTTTATWWTSPEIPGEVFKLEQRLSGKWEGMVRMVLTEVAAPTPATRPATGP